MIRLSAFFLLLVLPGQAQTEFEAASVKPYAPPPPVYGRATQTGSAVAGGPGTSDPGLIRWDIASLKALILQAYSVNTYQISGPDWIDSERYSIVAKVAPGATKEQVQLMWRNLLAGRFGLKLHREIREINAYELTVARGGPKLKESVPPKPLLPPPGSEGQVMRVSTTNDSDGCMVFPDGRRGLSTSSSPGHFKFCGGGMTLASLSNLLSPHLTRPLLDKTGLTGKYDFFLDFDPENSATADDNTAPSLAANFLKLGLKLDARKSSIEFLVIDKVQRRPSDN